MRASRRMFHDGAVVGVGLGRSVFAAGMLVALCPAALAGPKGEKVVQGHAVFQRAGVVTTIHAGHNSVINYSSFNIGSHETVRFVQPSATSRVLNRVLSHDPTIIDGRLESNGLVYIANPSGIYFGGNAVVNVGGIVAAAGTITNEDFLGGVDRFTGLSGGAVNSGVMRGSRIDLVGKYVANHGVVYADHGTVTMTAGDEVLIGPRAGGLYVKVKDQKARDVLGQPGVDNTGTINAPGGASLLTAGDFYSLAVRNTGSISARRIGIDAGRRVEVSGSLDASADAPGESGGRIEVLGQTVVLDRARVDASGDARGGEILIGGDFQGRAGTRTATTTTISDGTTLRADAGTEGDGGRVIVWSDDVTRYAGDLSARGGSQGGDGGFAEVSGKDTLVFAGTADLGADAGDGGALLLDPKNITIADGGAAPVNANNNFGENPGASVTFDADLITAITNTGTDLTLQASNNITVNEVIVTNNGGGDGGALTLQAGQTIAINANITTDNGALTLVANETAGNGVVNAQRDAGSAAITIADGVTLDTGTADIVVRVDTGAGLTNNASGDISLENLTTTGNIAVRNIGPTAGSDILRTSADALLTAATIALDVNGAGGGAGIGSPASPIRLATGNLEARAQAGGVSVSSSGSQLDIGGAVLLGLTGISTTAGGDVSVTNDQAILVGEDIVAAGDVALTSTTSGGITLANNDAITAGATMTLSATDGVTLNGDATAAGVVTVNADSNADGTGTFTITANDDLVSGGNDIAITAALAAIDAAATVNSGAGDIDILPSTTASTIGLGGGAGTLNLDATELAALASTGTVTIGLATGTGAVDIDALALAAETWGLSVRGGTTDAQAITLGTGEALSVLANGAATLNGAIVVPSGAISVTSIGGAVTTGAAATLTATGGTITLAGDDLTIAAAVSTGAGTGTVNLVPGAGRTVSISATPLQFDLSDAEIDFVQTNTLVIGAANSGAMVIDGLAPASTTDTPNITLVSGSTITEETADDAADVTVTGRVTLTAQGTIGASGGALLTGTGPLDINAGTLTGMSIAGDLHVKDTGGLTDADLAGGTVAIRSTGALTLGTVAAATLEAVAAAGNLTDSAGQDVVVTGNASFHTLGANDDIDLAELDVDGTISLNTAGATADATIVNATDIDLAASAVGGTLDATATTGSITDAGAVTATAASFTAATAGGDVILDQTTTAGTVSFDTTGLGGGVSFARSGDINLGTSSVGGNLTLIANAGGSIFDSGAATVGGNALFTASGGGSINLDQLNVNGGSSTITLNTAGSATIVNGAAVRLASSVVGATLNATANAGGIAISGASTVGGNLGLTAGGGGSITDAAAIQVSGNAAFNTIGGGAITLDLLDVDGAASTIALSTPGGATIVNTEIIRLAASTVGGTLSATAATGGITLVGASSAGGLTLVAQGGGSLSDSAAVQVTGNASFTTTGGGNINLDQLDVDGPASTIAVNTPGFATIQNTSAIRLAASSVGTTLTATADAGGIAVNGATAVGGNLDLTALAGGSITDAAATQVTGNASFTTTGGGSIALDQLDVDGAASTITVATPGSATIANTTAVRLAGANVGALFSATAITGGVTDSGAIVAGSAAFSANAAGINLDLLQVPGAIALDTPGAVTIVNTLGAGVATVIDDSDVGGLLTITSVNGGLQFGNAGGDEVAAGSLSVSALGNITDTGRLTIAGASSLDSGGGSVLLDNTANDFGGTVSVANATDVSLADASALSVAAINISGDLSLTSSGPLTQTGALVVGQQTTLAAGSGDITLDNPANEFGTGVRIVSAGDVSLRDATALAFTGGATSVSGDLAVQAAGDITQASALAVGGAATFDAGAGNDVLLAGANNFGGAVGATAQDVDLNDTGALVLGDIAGATLDVTAGGDVTQAAGTALSLGGASSFDAGANDVLLGNAGNDFGGAVDVTGGAVALTDTGAIQLGNVAATSLAVGAGGPVTQTGGPDLIDVAALTTLSLSTPSDVTLNNAANDFGTVSVTNGDTVVLRDTGGIVLGSIGTGGQLSVTSTGPITDTGTLSVTGLLVLKTLNSTAGIGLIDLDSPGSVFGQVRVSTRDATDAFNVVSPISVFENSSMNLGLVQTAGDGEFIAAGAMIDSGALQIGGDATFLTRTAGGAAIILDNAGSAFGRITARSENVAGTPGVLTGGNITIAEAGPMALLEVATQGDVTLTATGAILEAATGADAAPDVVADAATITAGGAIGGSAGTFLETAVETLSATTTAAGAVLIDEVAGGITLQTVTTAAGNVTVQADNLVRALSVTANSDVTLTAASGGIEVGQITASGGGTVTLAASGGAIFETGLGDAQVDVIGGALVASGTQIGGAGELDLETNVGALTVTAPSGIQVTNIGASGNILTATINGGAGAAALTNNGTIATGGAWTAGALTVVANDLAITGPITANSVAIRRHTTGPIALGAGAGPGMLISGSELGQIDAGALSVGGPGTTAITVDGVSAAATGALDAVTLDATDPGGIVIFSGGASTFNALTVLADNGISVQSDLGTDTGALSLDGDADDAADGMDSVSIGSGRLVSSAGALGLSAATGGIDAGAGATLSAAGPLTINHAVAGAGDLTVQSDVGVNLLADVAGAGAMAIAADADANGTGVLTVASGATVSSTGLLVLSGADLDLDGSVASPGADVAITRSSGGTIGLGGAGGDLGLSGDELSRITAADLYVGDRAGFGAAVTGITVDGLTSAQTFGVSGAVRLGARAPGGAVLFSGGPSFFQSLSVASGGATTIDTAVSSSGSMEFDNTGALVINPVLVTIVAPGGLTQTGTGPVSLGASVLATSGGVSFAGPVQLTDNVTLTGSSIALGAVDSAGSARSLVLNTTGGGVTTLSGSLGAGAALGDFSTNADGSTRLAATISVDAATVTFGDSIAGDGVASRSLAVTTTAGDAVFGGDVDLSGNVGSAGGAFSVDSAADILVSGDISTRGGAAASPGNAGGDVTLDASQGSIVIAGIDASGSDAVDPGAGGDGGTITLLPDRDLVFRLAGTENYLAPVGTITMLGDILARGGAGAGGGAAGEGGLIEFAPNGRIPTGASSSTPWVGTILAYRRDGSGALTSVSVAMDASGAPGTGAIRFGPNEKLVVTGDLALTAGLIRVGDVTTGGNMTFTAPTIELVARDKANLLFADDGNAQTLQVGEDRGPDYVAGGDIVFRSSALGGDPTVLIDGVLPQGVQPIFADRDGVRQGAPASYSYLLFPSADLELQYQSDPQNPEVILDLNARGSSAQTVSTALAGSLPVFEVGEVTESTSLDTGQKDKIRQLGITPRDLTVDERFLVLLGRTLYNDYPHVASARDPAASAARDYPVAVNRLVSDRVNVVIQGYDRLFNKDAVDEQTGQSRRVDRTDEIRDVLTQSVRRYREQPGVSGVDPAAYRQYLEQAGEVEAEPLDLVRGLEMFLKEMRLLGLGPREERNAFDELLNPIRPRGIATNDQLLGVILKGE